MEALLERALTTGSRDVSSIPKEPDVLARILTFSAPAIPKRIAAKTGIPITDAEELFAETLKYLYVCRQARKARIPIAPSLALDDAWHNFILFTQEYARFSEQYLGEFIHHVPSVDEPTTAKYSESRQAAEFLLGSLSAKIWPDGGMADCCQSIPSCTECQPPCGSDGNG